MKVSELIALADELAPNPFSATVKLGLVNELQAKIQMDVFLVEAKDVDMVASADAATTELLLPEARNSLYLAWMRAKYYWLMGEYEIYQNEKALFDDEWDALVRDECERCHRGTG